MDDFSYKTRTQGAVGSERMQLLSIIAHYWDELERYENEGGTQRQKWDLWEMIAAEFNNHPSVSVIRTPLQVKTLFKNMKTKARKYRQRIEESKSTGVVIETDPISETVLKLNKYQSRESLNAVLEPLNNLYYLSRKSVSLPVLSENDQGNNSFIPMLSTSVSSRIKSTTSDESVTNHEDERIELGPNSMMSETNSKQQQTTLREDSLRSDDASPHSDSVDTSQVHTFGDISVTALSSAENNASPFRIHHLSLLPSLNRNKPDAPDDPMSNENPPKKTSSSQRQNPLKRPLSVLLEGESASPLETYNTLASGCQHGAHSSPLPKYGTEGHCCCPDYHNEMIALALKEHEMRMALLAEEILCQRAERSLHEEERRSREQNSLFRREERQDALAEHRARMKVIQLECEAVQARIRNTERNSNNNKWLLRNGSKEV